MAIAQQLGQFTHEGGQAFFDPNLRRRVVEQHVERRDSAQSVEEQIVNLLCGLFFAGRWGTCRRQSRRHGGLLCRYRHQKLLPLVELWLHTRRNILGNTSAKYFCSTSTL